MSGCCFGFESSSGGTSGAVTGSGTLNYLPKWTPDGVTLGNSQIFDNGTNVGVGTVLPTAKFHVLQNTIGTGAKAFKVDINTWGEVLNIDDNTYFNYRGLGANFDGGVNVISSGVYPSITFKYNSGTNTSGSLYGVGASMFLQAPTFGIGNVNFAVSASLHVQGVDATSVNFALKVDNFASSPLLYVRNDGNVGIGTSSPLTQFQISTPNANQASYNFSVVNGSDIIFSGLNNGYFGIKCTPSKRFDIQVNENTDEFIRYTNISIGSSARTGLNIVNDLNSNLLLVNTSSNYTPYGAMASNKSVLYSSNDLVLMADSGSRMIFATGSTPATEKMTLLSNGNFGIGTSTPTAKLQVVGLDTYADNAAAITGGLTAGAFYIRTGHGLDVVV